MAIVRRLSAPLATSDHAWQRLDFLRLVAACGILVHHSYEFAIPASVRSAAMHRTEGLALFVDLFFAISGFTIASMYAGRMASLTDYMRFLSRRASRLLPLHWLTFLVSALFWIFVVKSGISSDHIPQLDASCTLRTVFLLHGVFACQAVNGVSWSISAEMIFYILFPAIALMARPAARVLTAILALAAVIVTAFIFKSVADWTALPPVIRGIPSFTLGVIMFNARPAIEKLIVADSAFYAAAILMIFTMISPSPPWLTVCLCYITVVAAICGDIHNKSTPLLRKLAPGAVLTYSIYMWHTLFIILVPNAIGDKILHLEPLPMSFLLLLTYALIFFASLISYIYWEEPLRRIINETYDRKLREKL